MLETAKIWSKISERWKRETQVQRTRSRRWKSEEAEEVMRSQGGWVVCLGEELKVVVREEKEVEDKRTRQRVMKAMMYM